MAFKYFVLFPLQEKAATQAVCSYLVNLLGSVVYATRECVQRSIQLHDCGSTRYFMAKSKVFCYLKKMVQIGLNEHYWSHSAQNWPS